MKYVVVRCEDTAIGPPERFTSLLAAARLTHVQELAQAGAVGAVSLDHGLRGARGFPSHWTWLGYTAADVAGDPRGSLSWEASRCYADSLQIACEPNEIAWCCELVTQQDGRIIDPTGGRLTTKEAAPLIDALNTQLGTTALRWVVGENCHHMLFVRDPAWAEELATAPIDPPEQWLGRPWRKAIPRNALGTWLQRLLTDTTALLEDHEVNRVRVDLKENPANMLWVWGPSQGRTIPPFRERHGVSGMIVGPAFPYRGLAHATEMAWAEGISRLTESQLHRLSRELPKLVAKHDVLYLPLRVDDADPVERQCAMERLDQQLIKPLLDTLMQVGAFRCLISIDDRQTGLSPFVAWGTDVASHPVIRLTSEAAAKTPLVFHDGGSLFQWLMKT